MLFFIHLTLSFKEKDRLKKDGSVIQLSTIQYFNLKKEKPIGKKVS